MPPEPTINSDLDVGEDASSSHAVACTQCRKKKQRCSRDDPCRSCMASGSLCIYEEGQRRGAKTGYIENLTKRMDTLEALVLGQSLLLSPSLASTRTSGTTENITLKAQLQSVRENLLNPLKRRLGSDSSAISETLPPALRENGARELLPFSNGADINGPHDILPPREMLDELITMYFDNIHPWIPILHQSTFRAALKSSNNKPSVTVLQAITAAAIKFHPNVDHETQEWYHKRCHDAVVLASMDRFSVESLQASIIIAFDTIGSGKGPRSWSIVASMTRIVENIGLAVEPEDVADNKLLNRIGFLSPPSSWTESESLRRIFWCIFLMDRFCSVTTGWNTSLTSTDVKRRLPVEGTFWRDHIEKKARYFNIGEHSLDSEDETNALGGLAYFVESTECLTRVVTFLRLPVDFSARDGLRRWFDGFQNLDAMLVRWKTFLPLRWQVARIVDESGRVDENLTAAHISHNSSVIMLHQNIAYPDATKNFHLHLPSRDAVKTCLAAAGEIATIAVQFLAQTKAIVSPNFSFCLFVAARALLAHATHFDMPVDPNFETLVRSLREASSRWTANSNRPSNDNLAGQFADRLDSALRSKSPINVRSAALANEEEDSAPVMSLASPPFPDVFRYGSANQSPNLHHLIDGTSSSNDVYGIPSVNNLDDFDRIFSWADDLIGS